MDELMARSVADRGAEERFPSGCVCSGSQGSITRRAHLGRATIWWTRWLMDRQRLRSRLRRILAVGGILAALAYLGPIAIQVRPRWGADRASAHLEDMRAAMEAKLASDASRQAEQLRRERRMSEAERWARELEEHRRSESLHRRNSHELLRRWW